MLVYQRVNTSCESASPSSFSVSAGCGCDVSQRHLRGLVSLLFYSFPNVVAETQKVKDDQKATALRTKSDFNPCVLPNAKIIHDSGVFRCCLVKVSLFTRSSELRFLMIIVSFPTIPSLHTFDINKVTLIINGWLKHCRSSLTLWSFMVDFSRGVAGNHVANLGGEVAAWRHKKR